MPFQIAIMRLYEQVCQNVAGAACPGMTQYVNTVHKMNTLFFLIASRYITANVEHS